jgi:hypothetical protein
MIFGDDVHQLPATPFRIKLGQFNAKNAKLGILARSFFGAEHYSVFRLFGIVHFLILLRSTSYDSIFPYVDKNVKGV